MGEYIDRAKGKAKQVEGRLTGDDARKRQGAVDQVKGNLKGVVRKAESAAKNIGDALKATFKRNRAK
jgi:uncharacterized protein YjbJ (UPF0337 family)